MSVQIKGVGTIGGIDQGLDTVGVVTATSFVGTGVSVVGVVTATSFVGSGANLTSLPAQATIANNADNRVITGGSGVNLNGEANLTFDGSTFAITGGVTATALSTFSASGSALRLNDGSILRLGNADADFFLYHDGSSTDYISAGAGKQLRLTTDDFVIKGANNTETLMTAAKDGSVGLYNDNEIVFQTSSSQVQAKRRIQIHADAPGSGHGMSIGQWDGSNHRIEGDSNRPMMITSYNSTGIKMGVSGANKVAVNSHGIVFNGDTSADNALDDYEEGSFTPYLRGNNNNSSPQINGNGSYVKVGRMVYINVHFGNKNGTHLPSGEYLMLYNLPFTHNSGMDAQIYCPFTYKVQFNSSYQYMGYIPNNNTVVWFYYNRNNATWQPWGTDQWRQSQIYATSSFTYKTSS